MRHLETIKQSGHKLDAFYLRTLLMHKAAKSFDDLQTVSGVSAPTFQEACYLHGLLDSDRECDVVMSEVALQGMPHMLRQVFVSLLVNCTPADPATFSERHITTLGEYIQFKKNEHKETKQISAGTCNRVLLLLQEMLD